MAKKLKIENIYQILEKSGLSSSEELTKELDISRATLSRVIAKADSRLKKFGKTRNQTYGLIKPVSGTESELPVYLIDTNGKIKPISRLYFLHNHKYVIEEPYRIYDGVPMEIQDMFPQGFMGRAFANQHHRELALPQRLNDWSDEHHLIAISRKGEDCPGNLITGEESALRFQRLNPENISRKKYPDLAQLAIDLQPRGSSAGGEQVKFTVYRNEKHYIVKFAFLKGSKSQKRWCDLLICEHIALKTLQNNGITTARTSLHEIKDILFLEVERFDRAGTKGRKPAISLASLDNHFFGQRDTWAKAATRLESKKLINKTDAEKLKLLDVFSELTGDSDRHFHNILFLPDTENPFNSKSWKLAPAFDKLPMIFAPVSENIPNVNFEMPVPKTQTMELWDTGVQIAHEFWENIVSEKRISKDFRKIASDIFRKNF